MKKAGFIAVIIALLSATFSIAESEKYISKKVGKVYGVRLALLILTW